MAMVVTTKLQPKRPRALALAVLLLAVMGMESGARSEEVATTGSNEEDSRPEMSRAEWQQRVEEAKRRAEEAAIERRNHPELYAPPPPEDPEMIATERVLNDDTLQNGDIIATNKGPFVFRGRSDRPHRDTDFVPVPDK